LSTVEWSNRLVQVEEITYWHAVDLFAEFAFDRRPRFGEALIGHAPE